MEPKKLLLVDDELELLEIYSEFLEEEGYQVSTASTVDLALEHLAKQSYDVLLCDFTMPCGGLKRLFEQTREENLTLPPVYVISGHAKEDLASSFDHKIEGLFSKPLDFEKLLSTLQQKHS